MYASLKVTLFVLIVIQLSLAAVLNSDPLSKDSKLSLGYSQNTILNFTEATAKNQYRSDEHIVVTEDGYVLTMFRIVEARNCYGEKKQRPVLITHGLLENSDIFLDAGPSSALGYLLSDACYDTWFGNQRGNNYGRKHLQLDPDEDAEFWQFSIDEMSFYDVPAMIDYILEHTKADKVNYIGFSQGGGVYFSMCSERPDYCKKTAVMIALAPAVIFENNESLVLKLLFQSAVFFRRFFVTAGIHEVFRKGNLIQQLLEYVCQITGPTWIAILCGTCGFFDNFHPGSISADSQKLVFTHFLVGGSLNTIVQYGQILNSGKYQKFDFGEKLNLKRHNRRQPPKYNLNAVSTPVVLIQGANDKLVNIKDTRTLSNKLPNVLEMVEVLDPGWTHLDMIYGRNIKNMVYRKVNEYLHKYSYSETSEE